MKPHSQHDGTAVRSVAGEYLQELENLAGSERQKQEEAVMVSMASLYHGKPLYFRIKEIRLTRPFQLV